MFNLIHIALETVLYACACAVVGFVYSVMLTEPKHIFNWFYRKANENLPWWIAKPIITCERCVTGEIALWAYLIEHWSVTEYNPYQHFTLISLAILMVAWLKHKLQWMEN